MKRGGCGAEPEEKFGLPGVGTAVEWLSGFVRFHPSGFLFHTNHGDNERQWICSFISGTIVK